MPCRKHSRLARSHTHFRSSLFSPLSHSLLHPPGALLLQAHDLLRRPDSSSHLRNKIKRPRTVVERLSPPGYRFAPICGARIFLPSVLLRAKIRPLHETRTSSSAPGSDARLSPTSHARRTHNRKTMISYPVPATKTRKKARFCVLSCFGCGGGI